MPYTTEIGDDEAAELTRRNLADSLERALRMGDDDEQGRALVAALVITHEYYSTVDQHLQLLKDLKDDLNEFDNRHIKDFTADGSESEVDVVNHDDGSATISVNVDERLLNHLARKGIEYTVLQEMLGNPSMSDILHWVELGKQEEKTDDIMDRLKEAWFLKEDD